MKNIIILSVSLGLTCLIAATVLTYFNNLTMPARVAAELEQRFSAMQAVFPEAEFTEEVEPLEVVQDNQSFLFYPALRPDQELLGVAAIGASPRGYGGEIRVLVGIDLADDAVRKVVVIDHSETPGLGSRVTDRRVRRSIGDFLARAPREEAGEEDQPSRLPPNPFLDQFTNAPIAERDIFRVVTAQDAVRAPVRDVVAISGATISSQGVADAVSRVLAAYHENKEDILGRFE